jgi:hypothetical protein
MKKFTWMSLIIVVFTSAVYLCFSHKAVSQIDLDNMFGGGSCPGTLNCQTTPPANPQNGSTYCAIGENYTDCVDSSNSNATCDTYYDNDNKKYCGKKAVFNGSTGQWASTNYPCIIIPNNVTGHNCAG